MQGSPRSPASRSFSANLECKTTIYEDLLGDWVVVVTFEGRRGRATELHHYCQSERQARSTVRRIVALIRNMKKVQRLLLSYCTGKSVAQTSRRIGKRIKACDSVSSEELDPLQELAQHFVRLLFDGDTMRDLHMRLILTQAITMADTLSRSQRTSNSKIVEMVPLMRYSYLDYSVATFFAKCDHGDVIVARLTAAGIWYVGDLVGWRATEVGKILDNRVLLKAVKQELSEICLGLGMYSQGWCKQKRIA